MKKLFLFIILICLVYNNIFAARTEYELLAKYSIDNGITWSPEFKNYSVSSIKNFLGGNNILQILAGDTVGLFKNYILKNSSNLTNKIGLVYDYNDNTFKNTYLDFLKFGILGNVVNERYITPRKTARAAHTKFKIFQTLSDTNFVWGHIYIGGKAGTAEIKKLSIQSDSNGFWTTKNIPDPYGFEDCIAVYVDTDNHKNYIYILGYGGYKRNIIRYDYLNDLWFDLGEKNVSINNYGSQAKYIPNRNSIIIASNYNAFFTPTTLLFYELDLNTMNMTQIAISINGGAGVYWAGFSMEYINNFLYIIGGKSNRSGSIKYNRVARLNLSTMQFEFIEDLTGGKLRDDLVDYGHQVKTVVFNNFIYVLRGGGCDRFDNSYINPITKIEEWDYNTNQSKRVITLTGVSLGNLYHFIIYPEYNRIRFVGGEGITTGTTYRDILEIY